jgi:energy-converting hydrogenase Eha subunit E
MTKQKIKPSLGLLAIPIFLFILAISVSVYLMIDPIQEMMDIETQNLGTETIFQAYDDFEQYQVFLELDSDESFYSVSTSNGNITVQTKDSDGNYATYEFQLKYYGSLQTVYYEVFEPTGTTTINNLTLVFIIELEFDGRYGIDSNSIGETREFAVNQTDVVSLLSGIFIAVGVGLVIGFVAVVALVIILIMRSSYKKKIKKEQEFSMDEPVTVEDNLTKE